MPRSRPALAESRGGAVLVEEHVDGPEVTVNAVSLDGRFVPLTVTDRLTAEPPAFGVALAHAWPSVARRGGGRRRRARRRSRRVGIRTGRRTPSCALGSRRAGGDGGRRAPRRRSRRGALRGGDRRRPERARGRPRAGGASERHRVTSPSRGRHRAGSVGGACVVFLVPPAGTARGRRGRRRRPRRVPGVDGCGSTGGRGTSSGRCGAARTARGRCSRRAPTARRRSSGLAVRRTPYASGSMRTPS